MHISMGQRQHCQKSVVLRPKTPRQKHPTAYKTHRMRYAPAARRRTDGYPRPPINMPKGWSRGNHGPVDACAERVCGTGFQAVLWYSGDSLAVDIRLAAVGQGARFTHAIVKLCAPERSDFCHIGRSICQTNRAPVERRPVEPVPSPGFVQRSITVAELGGTGSPNLALAERLGKHRVRGKEVP
jgi:hypothetical protein